MHSGRALSRVVFDHHTDRVAGVKHQRPGQTAPRRLPTTIGGGCYFVCPVMDRSRSEPFAHQQAAAFGFVGLLDRAVKFSVMSRVFARVPLVHPVFDAVQSDPTRPDPDAPARNWEPSTSRPMVRCREG